MTKLNFQHHSTLKHLMILQNHQCANLTLNQHLFFVKTNRKFKRTAFVLLLLLINLNVLAA